MRAVLAISATAALLLGAIWLVRQTLAPLPPDGYRALPVDTQQPAR